MSLGFGARVKSVVSIIDFAGRDGSSDNSSGGSRTSGGGPVVPPRSPFVTLVEAPPPENFEHYMPWLFTQWQCLYLVAIARRKQEHYTPAAPPKKKLEIRVKSMTSKLLGTVDTSTTKYDQSYTSVIVKTSFEAKRSVTIRREQEKYLKDTIPIEAFYDPLDHLVGIHISDMPMKMPIELTRAFHITFPLQPNLTKLCIFRGKLSALIICDIGLLLPLCHLTEVSLDDNYVKEGNYYSLLEETSSLRYLSLKRCRINDVILSKIIKRLVPGKPAEKHFMMLDLTGNNVTDVGAALLGQLLRVNRRILYLNLCGNMITDEGAIAILKHLKEYKLNDVEFLEFNKRKMKYLQLKQKTYNKLLTEQSKKRQQPERVASASHHTSGRKSVGSAKAARQSTAAKSKSTDMMDLRLNEMVGPFIDIFDEDHTVVRAGKYFCTGNFRLAWLNLACNNLTYLSLEVLTEVLHHQSMQKKGENTGLLRVVIEGNYLPVYCDEYAYINVYLSKAVAESTMVSAKRALAVKKRHLW